MSLNKIVLSICLFVTLLCQSVDVNAQDKLFEYPTPPDELETLTERTNYLVNHFWDRCPMQSAILRRDDFKAAFIDYASFFPYANAEVVLESIQRLIVTYEKKPENLLTLAEIAEEALYNGDAEFTSDDAFLPFAKAVANHKKISKTRKARFIHEANIIELSAVGAEAPDFEYTKPDGSKEKLSTTRGAHVLLFFNDPQCDECLFARVRLSADFNVNQLIEDGLLRIVSIYPDEYTEEWASQVSTYNSRWIVGAAPDVDELYDMRSTPTMYYISPKGKILSKTLVIDNLIEAFRQVNEKIERK